MTEVHTLEPLETHFRWLTQNEKNGNKKLLCTSATLITNLHVVRERKIC